MGELRSYLSLSIAISLLIGVSMLPAAEFRSGERLDYTFSYKGVVSGFIKIDIAHASFSVTTEPVSIDGYSVYRASCEVSTEPFAQAELIYPFRYRFSSWFESSRQIPHLSLEYMRTNEIEEELLWFDRKQGLAFRYHKSQTPTVQEARPPAFQLPGLDLDPRQWSLAEGAQRQPLSDTGVWGYLSLLYRLRFGDLPAGEWFDLPVYNGKGIKTYRVEVTRERLRRDGWDLPAFKLNLYEVRNGRRKGDKNTLIWISDDELRRPLLFQVVRLVGVFEGILETGRPVRK
jgi:hypothetical protein